MKKYSTWNRSQSRTTGSDRADRLCRVPAIVAVLLYVVSPSWGQTVNQEMVQGVEDATAKLSAQFREIRRDVLGADALAKEYARVGFNYEELDINEYLSTEVASTRINRVLDMISNVTASSSSSNDTSSDRLEEWCCKGCTQDPLLSTIADTISIDQSMMMVELEFGHVDGSVMRYPLPCPQGDNHPHSHLQPWYMNMMRRKPLEIVLVVDLSNFLNSDMLVDDLRFAARAVLDSLTRQDRVKVILVGQSVLKSEGDNVLPLCTSNLEQMRNLIKNGEPTRSSDEPGAYIEAFRIAFNSLTSVNNTDADRLILFLTSGLNKLDSDVFAWARGNITKQNADQGSSAVISAYYNGLTTERQSDPLEQLVNENHGVLKEFQSGEDVWDYYNVFNNVTAPENFTRALVERRINSRGDPSLSFSIALTDNSDNLLGIFRVLFPWEMLFTMVGGLLERKSGGSHFFVVNRDGEVLFHPLVPGDFQSRVSVASLESQTLMDRLQQQYPSNQSDIEVKAEKAVFTATSVRGGDKNSFVSREISVTYHCRSLSNEVAQLYVCVVVSSKDMAIAQLKDDISNIYRTDADRAPLYHTSPIPVEEQCLYFCTSSAKDKVSVQLTRPSQPPRDVGLSQITQFLENNPSTTPSWAEDGVPNELGVVSVVGETWRDVTNVSDFVIRRHLATPSGVYLSYPFARLNTNFVAAGTEWYVLSAAHLQEDMITVTPPRPDPLWGAGHVVSIGTSVTVPPQSQDGDRGGLLAVVAADLTLTSLKSLVMDSLPLCSVPGFSCFLLDDQGNLLYHELLFTSNTFKRLMAEPIFFIQPELSTEFSNILSNMVNESFAQKLRCLDYLNSTVRQRLFLSIDTNMDDVFHGDHYAIRNVPGTNVFLGVNRRVRNSLLCFCSKNCQTCSENESEGCECPCQCPEDCSTPHEFPACPETTLPAHNLAVEGVDTNTDKDTDFCIPLDCSCKSDQTDCEASRECHWCSSSNICRHATECCSTLEGPEACCSNSPFANLTCITNTCKNNEGKATGECVIIPPTSRNSSDTTASVVGGIVGALLVIILILVATGFILWVRFFRKGLYEDDTKENNFDFSNNKPKAKNPLTEEQVKNDNGSGGETVHLENQGSGGKEKADLGGGITPV